jgi:hypothetical protein
MCAVSTGSGASRQWLYGFAVGQVQKYLLSSPRLRDLQGGSQLLEDLCGPEFDRAMELTGLRPGANADVLSRGAAGARVLARDVAAIRSLYSAWPALADRFAPGALIQHALVEFSEGGLAAAQRDLGRRLKQSRTDPLVPLPAASPVVDRCARSGEPAEYDATTREDGERVTERVDRATKRRMDAWRAIQRTHVSDVDRRLLDDEAVRDRHVFVHSRDGSDDGLTFDDDPYVAVVHADGNAVGDAVAESLSRDSSRTSESDRLRAFFDALTLATQDAARRATRSALIPHAEPADEVRVIAARPIVVGGDDVTIVVRARHGLAFARDFLCEFERATRERLGEFRRDGAGLSACAGVAWAKVGFPFDRAYELAESLCAAAKRASRRAAGPGGVPSSLAFHRVTTSLSDDASAVLDHELTHRSDGKELRLTLGAYATGERPTALPSLADLEALAAAIPSGQRGVFREILRLQRVEPEYAEEALRRALHVLRARSGGREAADTFARLLATLTGRADRLWTQGGESPLGDAFVVRTMSGSSEDAS